MASAKLLEWTAYMLLCLVTLACKPGVSPQISDAATANAQAAPWLNKLIQEIEQDKPANPPAKIYRYTYNNQEVYYLTSRCCDIPSKLYNAQGIILCEPGRYYRQGRRPLPRLL